MQIKIGILSAAFISGDFVISLRNLDPATYKIVAIGASTLEGAQKFANQFGIPKAYGSYQELVEDEEVQLVYIANRNLYHYAAAKLAIEHGKHVLIEKPMTIDMRTAKHLFELARKNGVFIMEALWTRFLPIWQRIREVIHSGEIGDVIHVVTNYVVSNKTDRIMLKRHGGGVTLDLGTYATNAMLEGVKYCRPKDVKAFARASLPNEADTSVAAIFDFPNECTATMTLTARASGKANGGNEKLVPRMQHLTYIGTKGYLRINDWLSCPKSFEVNGKVVEVNVEDGQTGYHWKNSYGLCYQVKHAIECINSGQLTSDVHTPEDTLLRIETQRRILKQAGFDVVQTPVSYDFTPV